jgi:hypothetical protein
MSWVYAFCCTVLIGGLYVDGWSHQFLFDQIDSFFNIWHFPLYAGFAMSGLALVAWTQFRRHGSQRWIKAVPPGHLLSLFGTLLFLVGGMLDLLWHETFGFEKDIEGLISPSHLILAVGMCLMLSGGIRHWFARHAHDHEPGFLPALPLLVAMLATLGQWTFLTQYARYTDFNATGPLPVDEMFILCTQSISFLGILLFSALFTGLWTYVIRRVRLPFGALTFILCIQFFFLGFIRFGVPLAIAAVVAGLVGDILILKLRPWRSTAGLLWISFLVPAVLYAGVFLTLNTEQGGLWWSLHLWTGVPFFAGIAGLLTGLLGTANSMKK